MDMTRSLWLVTAARKTGKTTYCRALASQARAAGWQVAGLLSPAVFENGLKIGILTENLGTGEIRPLAIQATAASSLPGTFDLPFGTWRFSSATLAWGDHCLETCLPCDLFIVDELGPLELIHHQGWKSALQVLRQRHYRLGLVVVRPELVETARQVLSIDALLTPPFDTSLMFQELGG